jgi:hypothetical protein
VVLTGGATNELTGNKAAKFDIIMNDPDFSNTGALYLHPTFNTFTYDKYGAYGNLVSRLVRIYPYLKPIGV